MTNAEDEDVTKSRRALVNLCLDLAAVERHHEDDPTNDEVLGQARRSLEAAVDTSAWVLTQFIGPPPEG
jgi:hypothetical protein